MATNYSCPIVCLEILKSKIGTAKTPLVLSDNVDLAPVALPNNVDLGPPPFALNDIAEVPVDAPLANAKAVAKRAPPAPRHYLFRVDLGGVPPAHPHEPKPKSSSSSSSSSSDTGESPNAEVAGGHIDFWPS